MRRQRWLAAVVLLGLCLPATAAELVLVEQGQPRAQVVVADGTTGIVGAAAADFVRVIQRMSGATLPLVGEGEADPARPWVQIGALKRTQGPSADPSAITGDEAYAGYAIASDERGLSLRGNTPVGTANAVYGFLQDQLGVRWFLPTETFEVVPKRTTVTVPALRQTVRPSFVCRLGSASGNAEFTPWAHRLRWDFDQGGFAVPYAAGFRHWMYAVFPPSKYGQDHPEIYPLLRGKRAIPEHDGDQLAQPCTGNPETVRIAIETVNGYLDAHPECHTYPFSINDNNTWCECDLCRAQDVERPLYRGRKIYSDRWFTFVNAVARGVRAKHPDKYLGCFAYAGVELPPLKIERMEPNVFVDLTQDTAQYFDPAYRQVDYDLIRAWQAKCNHVGKYDYYGLGALAPRYYPHLLARDLKATHAMGVRAFHSELYPYWANMGPMLYVSSRTLWDVGLSPDRLLDEFYAAFGRAAGEMRAFYEVHERAWQSQKVGKWFGGIGSAAEQMDCYTADQVREAAEHLRRAAALATDDDVRARVKLIADGYAYPDLLLRGWTAARTIRTGPVRTAEEAMALARPAAALLEPLRREAETWKTSVVDDPVADAWYKGGARPSIRAQWRAAVQGGIVNALQSLNSWRQARGSAPPAELRALFDALAADPQVGLLWQALGGSLERGPNLLPNGGFEDVQAGKPGPTGPEWNSAGVATGWSTWQEDPADGVFFVDTRERHAGKSSGAFRGGNTLCYITTLPVTTGTTYLAEAWVRAPVVRGGTAVALEVRWQDAASHWFNGAPDLRVDAKHPGTWERLLIPFTAPPGAAMAVILLTGYGTAKDDVVRFDDVYVGEAKRAT